MNTHEIRSCCSGRIKVSCIVKDIRNEPGWMKSGCGIDCFLPVQIHMGWHVRGCISHGLHQMTMLFFQVFPAMRNICRVLPVPGNMPTVWF